MILRSMGATDPFAARVDAAFALRAEGVSDVTGPSDAGYDEARRVWNGMIDRQPAAIVRPTSVDGVRAAIAAARRHSLPIAVRAGGHNVAGNGTVEGGLVLDLGAWNDVEVDAVERVVRVRPGAVLADVDRATEAAGLVVPIGVVSGTGVAGLTLGGGVGWLTRAFGLTIDSLLAAEVVTAAGEVVRASAGENPELFWGLRGGGGNFGVVTQLEFRAHPWPADFAAGNLIYRKPNWHAALRAWREWGAGLPDELTTILTFLAPPPSWELGDETLLLVGGTWAGADPADGRRHLGDLAAMVPPDETSLDQTTWVAWQSAADELFPKGVRAYWRNASFDHLDDELLDVVQRNARTLAWQRTGIDIHLMRAAVSKVSEDATAFPNRAPAYLLNIYGTWDEPERDRDRIAWVRSFHAEVAPHAAQGQYVNFLGREDDDDARQAALTVYGADKLRRLIELKRRYDPDNTFRLNHNIDPAWPTDDLKASGA
jgi:FAD/FMN-containing dehydrogenase